MAVCILAALSFVANSADTGQEEEDAGIATEGFMQNAVIAKVYVQSPNFEVLDEKDSGAMTIVKEEETPEFYEGTLIRLKSEDLSKIKEVLANLKISKVIMHQKDAAIADKLKSGGFNVILKQ